MTEVLNREEDGNSDIPIEQLQEMYDRASVMDGAYVPDSPEGAGELIVPTHERRQHSTLPSQLGRLSIGKRSHIRLATPLPSFASHNPPGNYLG